MKAVSTSYLPFIRPQWNKEVINICINVDLKDMKYTESEVTWFYGK